MTGFRDLFAWLLGWRSASRVLPLGYHRHAGQVWHTGASAGRSFVVGADRSQGGLAGQVHTFG